MSWSLFVAGALAGGFINGLAGFGTALFALGFWLQFLPPTEAVKIVLIVSVVTGLPGLWIVRGAILDQPRRLVRFLVPAVFGLPLGIFALSLVNAGQLKVIVGAFLVLYGGYFSARRTMPVIEGPTPIVDSAVGFLGGILGGAASLSGALPTMWCSMRPWTKAETRAVLQPFNVVVLVLAAGIIAAQGGYTKETLQLLLVALPTSLVSAQIGIVVFKRLSDHGFRRLIISMTFVSGAVLLSRELL